MTGEGGRAAFLARPFVLPADVLVFPVAELATHLRDTLSCAEGDFAVSRPGFRTFSRIIDGETAELLEEFRRPTPIAAAVARHARRRGEPPVVLLERAFPALQRFSAAQILVPADSPLAEGVDASLAPGRLVGGYEVRRLVQVLQDTEIYLVRAAGSGAAALKLARSQAGAAMGPVIEREADVLAHLKGRCGPRLLEIGTHEGRAFLAMEWVSGVPLGARADELRASRPRAWRRALHELCCRLIRRYARLHLLGVVHGDVHPRNALVDASDRITLLDFGLSRRLVPGWAHDHGQRSGLAWFMEPEAAARLLRGAPLPAASVRGEQASVAALVYQLLCGEPYTDATPDRDEILRQVAESPPLPFSRRGFEAWPEVENVLARALEKDPARRFPDLEAFHKAFAAAGPREGGLAGAGGAGRAPRPRALARALEWVLQDAVHRPVALEAAFPRPPEASLESGAAGLAWFLYRAALIREDPLILAGADLWSRRALRRLGAADAFPGGGEGRAPAVAGPGSLLHHASGVHLVHALIRRASGDPAGFASAVERFVALGSPPTKPLEFAFGLSGRLSGGALLLEAPEWSDELDDRPLRHHLEGALAAHRELMAAEPPVGSGSGLGHVGVAHGWAGVLYGHLRACRALGVSVPAPVVGRLEELAGLGEPAGRGVAWPGTLPHPGQERETPQHAPGWCAGTAGHVHLWTLAHELVGDPRFLELARSAAWHTWEHPDRSGDLCCGLAGRGFALLRMYQYEGDPEWLVRARVLSSRCAGWMGASRARSAPSLSLFRGVPGPLALSMELEAPELAAMPAFAGEGWPERRARLRGPGPPVGRPARE